jgi:hypothetical protein
LRRRVPSGPGSAVCTVTSPPNEADTYRLEPAASAVGKTESVVVTAPVPARKFGPRTDHRNCSPEPDDTRCVEAVPECTGEATCVTPAPTGVHRLISSCAGASKKALFAVRVEMEKSDAWL